MESTNKTYTCPSCSNQIQFLHAETNIKVCSSCKMPIERVEGEVLMVKPILVLTFHNEFIQLGTKGSWQGKDFEVIGRIRFYFEESVFNYWTILFASGEITYMGEGYGLVGIYEKIKLSKHVTIGELDNMTYDYKSHELYEKTKFYIHRKYESKEYEIEGEIFLPYSKGNIKIYEFSSIKQQHVELMAFGNGLLNSYKVSYTDFASLSLTNTRKEGFTQKDFICKNCRNKVTVKTYPYAQSCTCSKCDSRLNLATGNVEGKEKTEYTDQYIALGTKGRIKDIEYEVIGCTLREESNKDASRWVEYTLYNREYGYAFISDFDGNFIFIKEVVNAPVVTRKNLKKIYYQEEPLMLYNNYLFKIVTAKGEFPGNIFNDTSISVSEYISPPDMWLQERSIKEGVNWLHGEHLSRSVVETEFKAKLPPKGSLGVVEPKGYVSQQQLVLTSAIAVALIILIHLIFSFAATEKVVVDQVYSINNSENPKTIVTEKFELTKWKSNLEVHISAEVGNSWFELSGTLVNAKTGDEYSFEQGVEYYFGYEGGEYWTEGSKSEKVYLSSIPKGTYFLQMTATKQNLSGLDNFSLTVKNDVAMEWNLIMILVMLLIWPIAKFIYVQQTERQRWYNSPFSPYTYED